MDGASVLELLDLYQDMTEKQDEIIRRLGGIVTRQAATLQLLKNDKEFFDTKLDDDMAAAGDAVEQYRDMKNGLEP